MYLRHKKPYLCYVQYRAHHVWHYCIHMQVTMHSPRNFFCCTLWCGHILSIWYGHLLGNLAPLTKDTGLDPVQRFHSSDDFHPQNVTFSACLPEMFSQILLLRRTGIPGKWMGAFQASTGGKSWDSHALQMKVITPMNNLCWIKPTRDAPFTYLVNLGSQHSG